MVLFSFVNYVFLLFYPFLLLCLLLLLFIIFSGSAAQRGLWPHRSRGFVITHSDAPQSVGLLWTSDQLVAETFTWQHTTHTQQTNIHAPGGIFFFLFARFVRFVFLCVQLSIRVLSYCVLWIFPLRKTRRLRSGANPRSWVPEASTQTPRPPKPLDSNPRSQQAGGRRPTP
jgi:hypothetical protein